MPPLLGYYLSYADARDLSSLAFSVAGLLLTAVADALWLVLTPFELGAVRSLRATL